MINEACEIIGTKHLDELSQAGITVVQVTDYHSSPSLVDENSMNTNYEDLNQQTIQLNDCSMNDFNLFENSEITIFSKNSDSNSTTNYLSSAFTLKDTNNNIEPSDNEDSNFYEVKHNRYFEAKIPSQASFALSINDWEKLQLLQRGHRFKRGEWEDYFVKGMKDSNKYCVFAFKDHYVNHSSIRKSRASMTRGGFCGSSPSSSSSSNDIIKIDGKKNFSANGYCVFADCSVKFLIKMNTERQVHVFYEGQVRHAINEVNARYFRGKSRQELKEALKHTTPLKEYLHRIENSKNVGGNVDYVGKSPTVYRRISSESKDPFQALLQLRNQFIQKKTDKQNASQSFRKHVSGYIQMIQHIPGSVVCYDQDQISLFHYLFTRNIQLSQNISTLFINCYKDASFVNTTMNNQKLYFYEMCLKVPMLKSYEQLVPLSCMFTTNKSASLSLNQWLTMFINSERSAYFDYDADLINQTRIRYIICENSMFLIETILNILNNETYQSYSNRCFLNLLKDSNDKIGYSEFSDLNNELSVNLKANDCSNQLIIHCCTNKIMNEISKLCKYYYQTNAENSSNTNLNFGIYAFNVIVNSQCLIDLQQSIYSFMCILYSETINSLVRKSFDYLKSRLDTYESFNTNNKTNEFYFYDFNLKDSATNSRKGSSTPTDLFAKSVGLSTLKEFQTNFNVEKIQLDKLNEQSIFFKLCEKLFDKCKSDVERSEFEELNLNLLKNPRKCHNLLYHFVRQFSACLPLWTKLLVPNTINNSVFPMTSTAHLDRFKLIANNQALAKEGLDFFIKKTHSENQKIIENYLNFSKNDEIFHRKKSSKSSLSDLVTSSQFNSQEEDDEEEEDNSDELNEYSTSQKVISSFSNDLNRVDTKKSTRSARKSIESIQNDYTQLKSNQETVIIIERECESLVQFEDELTKEDLEYLDNTDTLSLKIIEFYMKMLQLNLNENNSDFKVLIFPVKFYTELKIEYCNKCQNSKLSPDEANNIFNFNLVLIPIKKNDNLGLAAIDFRKRKITYYDPFLLNDFECLKILTDFIDKQYFLFKKEKYDFRNWKISNDKSIKNDNLKDTGVFILFIIKRLSNNQDVISITSNEIELFRSQIKNEIIQHLIGT